MKDLIASETYLAHAKKLSNDRRERVLSRMGQKLAKLKISEKIDCITAVALQLEIEDEMLNEWRQNFAKAKANHEANANKKEKGKVKSKKKK